jgi:UDP-4-amino-4,6-dideoxy-N-acetyl-beta-L-altrosamine N-acetyltransferase
MDSLGQLRPIQDGEISLMLSWRNTPSVRANMYTRHEISEEEHIAWWVRTSEKHDQKYFMYESADQPLGIVGISAIDYLNSNCSWAFYSAPNAPKGTGSKMEFLAIEYVFENLKLHKLTCEVLAFNTLVIKLHKKFGFVVEGILRHQNRYEDEYIDVYRLGLLQSDWINERSEILNKLTNHKKIST